MNTANGFAEVNGARLYFELAGQGRSLVLIHGGLVNHHLWNDQFDEFAQFYQVLRYDARGYGQSSTPTGPFSHPADLKALLDSLGIAQAYVLGLSMGGHIAIDFTLTQPDRVAALIPVASGLGGYQFDANPQLRAEMHEAYEQHDLARAVELSLQLWTDGPRRQPDQVNAAAREKIRALTLHTFSLPDFPNEWELAMQPPAFERLDEIHVPTLIVAGDQDVPDILKIADVLEAKIAGAQKMIIPNAAHHLNVEQPMEFNRIVLEFLSSLS
jgi:3-oxoadipate enol-lactonase